MPELSKLQRYEIMYSTGCCLNSETIDKNHESGSFNYPINIANKLLNALRCKNFSDSEVFFDELLMEIITNGIDDFILALTKLALSIQSLYEESNFNKNFECYHRITNLVGNIMRLNGMDEVNTYFLSLFELLCEDNSVVAVGKNKGIANSVADYINLTYHAPNLDLNAIAAVFKLSPNHIGKVFREEMGVSVSGFLNNVRLGVSLNLLKDTGKSINEIIEEVGFINESRYYKLFKKAYGVTPKEFRLDKALAEQVIKIAGKALN
jgi:YesN/AraC family two-component response regulator